jgi:hypothetical protein
MVLPATVSFGRLSLRRQSSKQPPASFFSEPDSMDHLRSVEDKTSFTNGTKAP